MHVHSTRRVRIAVLATLAAVFGAFAMLGAGSAGATTIGPDSFGYTATSTAESLRTLDGSATTLSVGDDQVEGFSIGFPFSFYGTVANDVYVSSNGFVSFDSFVNQGCCSGPALPSPDLDWYGVHNVVAGLWTDLCPGTGYSTTYCYGTIRTQTLGSAPNREFVADYDIVSYCCSLPAPRVKLQIILHETSNAIELQYGQLDLDPYSRNQSAGIALNASVGLQVAFGSITPTLAHSGWIISSGPLDADAPVATPVQAPAANGAGWNNSDVTVSWNWADETGGSGIDATACTTASTSTGEGTIVLTATCSDVAGNTGTATHTVKVDKTAPSVAFSGNAGAYGVDDTVTIGCTAGDSLSGIAASSCPTVNAPAYTLLGTHTLAASATDAAGNTATVTATYTVTLGGSGLCALVHQLSSSSDVADGLCDKIAQIVSAKAKGQAKVAANVLGAFNNQLKAQTGKALTSAEAALLASLAAQL